jgi:two-component system, cell cycle sensor histidine kinase and response regulator CckA
MSETIANIAEDEIARRTAFHALLLEHIDRAVVASDESKRLIYSNHLALEWFSGLPAPDRDDRAWSEQYGLFELDGVTPLALERNPVVRAFGGERFAGLEFRARRADGPPRYVRANGGPLVSADGRPLGAVVVIEDFTESVRALEEAQRVQAQLLHTQRLESVARLAGGVAHDFNNQLTVITGMLELALATLPEMDPIREDLLEARKASERAAGITRQLLAFSRQQVLRVETTDINEVVHGTIKMLGRLLGDDVVLQLALSESLPVVHTDPGQLQQVLINLAVNAREAMPRGGTVLLSTAMVESASPVEVVAGTLPAGRYVSVSVADEGHGFDAAHGAALFDPFVTEKSFGRGAGLGLPMVLGTVMQSGGGITMSSAQGQGSTFTILLPASATTTVVPATGVGTPAAGPPLATLLVVDDEPALRTVAGKILRRAGYETLIASGAEEALAIAEQHPTPITMLVTDVVMPGTGGVELAHELLARFPTMRVLFTSGYTDDTLLRHGIAGAQVDFIAKPYSLDALTRTVREILARDAGAM